MNCLIVAAHPDDEVLGAGGTISKLIGEGHSVSVALMCRSVSVRSNKSDTLSDDMTRAMKFLGVQQIYHADFPNIRMNTVPHLDLVQFVESVSATTISLSTRENVWFSSIRRIPAGISASA